MCKQSRIICGYFPAILLLITLVINSCSKVPGEPANPPASTDSTGRDTSKYRHIDLTTKVISSVSGFVASRNMGPQIPEGALVTYGNKTTLIDKYGYFEIKNASVIKQAAQLTISKKDFITNYRTFIAEEGQSFFIKMNLDHQPGGIYDVGSGGTHEDGSGTVVTLPRALVNESTNTPYTGFARPYLSTIDRGDEDMSEKMPGSARGLDSLGYPKFLNSIGIVTVAVHGMDGENLRLPEGATINCTFRYFGGGLPATIDAWHYDINTGLWRKEGTAIKTGFTYTVSINKLGSWNFALASDCVQFKARLLTEAGEPLSFTYVNALPAGQAFNNIKPAWLYTDVNGFVSGLVPAGSSFSLDVFGDQCNTPVYSKTFNTSDPVVSAGDIKIASQNIVSVNAKVTGCNGEGITNGFLMVTSPHNRYRLDASNKGVIHFNTVVCDFAQLQTLMFIAEDQDAMQASDNLYASLVPGNNELGNLSTCGVNGTVVFTGKVVDNAGVPLPGMFVKIAPAGSLPNAFQVESNADGVIKTSIYTNTNFTLTVYGAKDCNSPLLTRNFSTTNKDISIGNLAITGITTANVTGSVVDCNNKVITAGSVVVQRYTKTHVYKVNQAGVFNFTVRLCNAASAETITLLAQDEASSQTASPVNVTVSAGNNNVGTVKACFDSLSDLQFVNYTIDDTLSGSYIAPANTITQFLDPTGNFIFIRGSNTATGEGAGFQMSNSGMAAGSGQLLEEFSSPEVNGSIVPPIVVTITEYGAIGGYISGHFTGRVVQFSQSTAARKVICTFRVKRTE